MCHVSFRLLVLAFALAALPACIEPPELAADPPCDDITDGTPETADVRAAEPPAQPHWVEVGQPLTTIHRYAQTVTALADGRVLAVAGFRWDLNGGLDRPGDRQVAAGAELFDPASETWTRTGALNVARSAHQATLMADGRVLVTGGETDAFSGSGKLASAEIYDPIAGSWRETTPMHEARSRHAQVRLPDGRIWVGGGDGVTWLDSVEVFDPATETWTTWAPLAAKEPHVFDASVLGDGRVFVLGLFHVELYDPAVGSQPKPPDPPPYTAPLPYAPNEEVWCVTPGIGLATELPTGAVHVMALQTSVILDPEAFAAGCRTLLGPPEPLRGVVASVALPNGQILFAFGDRKAALMDPTTGLLTPLPERRVDRGTFHLVVLPGGSVLATGGADAPSEVLRWE